MCQVRGGPYVPCQPDAVLAQIELETGRPCPRMVLHPQNVDAWQLLTMGLDVDHQGFAAAFGAGLAAHYEPNEYRLLFARVRSVRADPAFQALLDEMREKHGDKPGAQTGREKDDGWMQDQ